MHFLAEVSEEELEEIGVTESSDRGKVRVASSFNCYHLFSLFFFYSYCKYLGRQLRVAIDQEQVRVILEI